MVKYLLVAKLKLYEIEIKNPNSCRKCHYPFSQQNNRAKGYGKGGTSRAKCQKVTNSEVRGTAKMGQTRANLYAIAGRLDHTRGCKII